MAWFLLTWTGARQGNEYDCGLYMLHFIETISEMVAPGATLPQTPPAKAHALLALKTPRAPPGPKAAVPDAGALAAKLDESPASSSIALCTRPRIREEGLSGAAAAAAGAAATPPGMPELPSCTEGDLDSRRICSCIIC